MYSHQKTRLGTSRVTFCRGLARHSPKPHHAWTLSYMRRGVHQVQAEGTMVRSQRESFPVKAARLPNFWCARSCQGPLVAAVTGSRGSTLSKHLYLYKTAHAVAMNRCWKRWQNTEQQCAQVCTQRHWEHTHAHARARTRTHASAHAHTHTRAHAHAHAHARAHI